MINIKAAEVMYCIAEDFVKLNRGQKFNLGLELGLVEHYDLNMSEEELEAKIFTNMHRQNKFSEFVTLMYQVMNE